MKKIVINPNNPPKLHIRMIRDILLKGGVVVYPTDTIYGLGASIYNQQAVNKVFEIKKRPYNKPVSICLSSVDEIEKLAYLDENMRKLASELLPGPFTLLVEKKENVHDLLATDNKIGVRVPANRLCQDISYQIPITTTSANISGQKNPKTIDEIIDRLGDKVDIYIDSGLQMDKEHSTVIDLTLNPPEIIRKGSGLGIANKYLKKIY